MAFLRQRTLAEGQTGCSGPGCSLHRLRLPGNQLHLVLLSDPVYVPLLVSLSAPMSVEQRAGPVHDACRARQHFGEMPAPAMVRLVQFVVVLALLTMSPADVAGTGGGNATAEPCPMDVGYVRTFPWEPLPCAGGAAKMTTCCQALLSVVGIGLASRLRATGCFPLPTAGPSAACLKGLAGRLSGAPLDHRGSSFAFVAYRGRNSSPSTPSSCVGVAIAGDFDASAANNSVEAFDSACGPDLVATTSVGTSGEAVRHLGKRRTEGGGKLKAGNPERSLPPVTYRPRAESRRHPEDAVEAV